MIYCHLYLSICIYLLSVFSILSIFYPNFISVSILYLYFISLSNFYLLLLLSLSIFYPYFTYLSIFYLCCISLSTFYLLLISVSIFYLYCKATLSSSVPLPLSHGKKVEGKNHQNNQRKQTQVVIEEIMSEMHSHRNNDSASPKYSEVGL